MNIRDEIRKLGKWYQTIEIDGVKTRDSGQSDIRLWNDIAETMIPKDLSGLRILDLGSSAGHFSCQAALLGAEVVGIEMDSGKSRSQAAFVKSYFEREYNTKLNITYIWKDILDVNFQKLGYFDYVFALSIIYHIGRRQYGGSYTPAALKAQKQALARIKTDKFIVRTRYTKKNNVEYYDGVFGGLGFVRTKGEQCGHRGLVLYERK